MTWWFETLVIAAWLCGLSVGAVLLLRLLLRPLLGSAAVYPLWLIPIATSVVALVVPRPAGSRILLNNPVLGSELQPAAGTPDWTAPLLAVWLAGFLLVVVFRLWSQRTFQQQLGQTIPLRRIGNIKVVSSAGLVAPFAMGICERKIVLPDGFNRLFDRSQRRLILKHEYLHHRWRDPLFNVLAELLRAFFWFHPLAHVGCHYFRLDQELCCDERVLRGGNAQQRSSYGEALLKATELNSSLSPGWASSRRKVAQRLRHLRRPRLVQLPLVFSFSVAMVLVGYASFTSWQLLPPLQPTLLDASRHATLMSNLSADELSENVMYAVQSNDRSLLSALLLQGANPEFIQPGHGTPLMVAARNGNIDMVQQLVSSKADVNAAVLTAGSPLIMAAKHNHQAVAEYLIRHGSDVNAHVFLDETPLINAARFGHAALAKSLIDAGADIDEEVTTFSITHLPFGTKSPMSEANRVGNADMVALLSTYSLEF